MPDKWRSAPTCGKQDYYWICMHRENDNPKPDEDIAALRQ